MSPPPRTFILPKFYLSVDRTPPVAACPEDITREVGLSQATIPIFFDAPTATDNSGVLPTIVSQSHLPNDLFGLGTTAVTYTFTDGSGNRGSCSFNVRIVQGQYY